MAFSMQSRYGYIYAVVFITLIYILNVLCSLKEHYKEDEDLSSVIEGNFKSIQKVKNSNFEELIKNTRTINQSDPRLLQLIRTKYLLPPSNLPYRMKEFKDPSHWQSKIVLNLLNGKKNGFFVEAGAFDGELYSNTLFMEKEYSWQGILVEPSLEYFSSILAKQRKAWFVPACLSPDPYPVELDLEFNEVATHLSPIKGNKVQLVQCFPLFSILLAVNRTDIDYFSLNVENIGMKVLQSIPWDQVRIKVLTVENQYLSYQENKTLYNLMDSLGYKELEKYPNYPDDFKVINSLFYHPIYIHT